VVPGSYSTLSAIAVASALLTVLIVVRMADLMRRLDEQRAELAGLARTDSLTGLPNRRSADAELSRVLERARATGDHVAVGMIDLDGFKQFNDSRGHQAGDDLLRGAARAWRGVLEGESSLARYGGEEFLLIATAPTGLGIHEQLERMLAATPQHQTFSAGVAYHRHSDPEESSATMIARADRALYRAKETGRNRIVDERELE